MSDATGVDDTSDSGVCVVQLSGSSVVNALLASSGRSVSFLRIFRQYVVFADKLLFPDTSSDRVCELFTVFASGTDFLKKEKICADVCQSDADLSAQFLLRDRLSGSNRLVCDRNAAQRSRLGRKAETSGAGSDQCRFIHWNGNDTVAAYFYSDSGT